MRCEDVTLTSCPQALTVTVEDGAAATQKVMNTQLDGRSSADNLRDGQLGRSSLTYDKSIVNDCWAGTQNVSTLYYLFPIEGYTMYI